MAYPDYPADGEKRFVTHERVLAYLYNYAKHYGVCEKIKVSIQLAYKKYFETLFKIKKFYLVSS